MRSPAHRGRWIATCACSYGRRGLSQQWCRRAMALEGGSEAGIGLGHCASDCRRGAGFVRARAASDFGLGVAEVFLPQHESLRMATRAVATFSQTVLMVGLSTELSASLRRTLGATILSLEAGDPEEARWIAQLYEADIDLVIWDETRFSTEARDRAYGRMRVRRPDLRVWPISISEGLTDAGMRELGERVKETLQVKSKTTTV